MRNAMFVVGLSLLLVACASKRTDKHDTNPVNWGNFKCTSQGASGRTYVGWATDEGTARSHAQAICGERSQSCHVTACQNDITDPESPES